LSLQASRMRTRKIKKKIMLTPILFTVPVKSFNKTYHQDTYASICRDDLASFLFHNYMKAAPSQQSSQSNIRPQPPKSSESKAEFLLQNGHIQKGYQILEGSSCVSIDDTRRQTLERLHPNRSSSIDNSVMAAFNLPERISLTPDEVLRKIKSQLKLKSPGFSKLRVEHLKECIGKQEADDEILFLVLLTRFLELIVNAELPRDFIRLLGSSVLIALPKSESDPSDVRPIPMGETYRKLASSLLMTKFQSTISTLMSDIQLWCRL
jgi:hypothetical protein